MLHPTVFVMGCHFRVADVAPELGGLIFKQAISGHPNIQRSNSDTGQLAQLDVDHHGFSINHTPRLMGKGLTFPAISTFSPRLN